MLQAAALEPGPQTIIGRKTDADNPKNVGQGHRIRVSQQKHEVRFIADKFKISGQAASGAIRAAGPMREKVYAYIREKKKSRHYA